MAASGAISIRGVKRRKSVSWLAHACMVSQAVVESTSYRLDVSPPWLTSIGSTPPIGDEVN